MHRAKLIDSIKGNFNKHDKFLQCVPQFYRNILCTSYDFKEHFEINHPVDQSLWLNKKNPITIGKETIFWNEWYDKGISVVRDIIDDKVINYIL